MKRPYLPTLILGLVLGSSLCFGQSTEPVTYVTLILDLLEAYQSPSPEADARIDADVAALDSETAASIAGHWKSVYLDPDYHLYLNGTDDPSGLAIADQGTSHAIVVLGYELQDGEMTEELMGRCDAAAALAQAFPESILVCTGGATGKNNPEGHTEAGLMKEYLAGTGGIEADRIFTDDRAMTTAENALNTFVILQQQDIKTMTIVTSSYHQRWGQVLYNAVGALYKEESGYSTEIIGNYCYDTEPSVELYRHDAEIAAVQLGQILHLSEKEQKELPQILR